MPRGDGTGPLGNGPMGSGRNNCQGMSAVRQKGMGKNNNTTSTKDESLEEQAARLEEQARNLRNLAKKNSANL